MININKQARDLLLSILIKQHPSMIDITFDTKIKDYSKSYYEELIMIILNEYTSSGLKEDEEPNEYGLKCEALIDEIIQLFDERTQFIYVDDFEQFERAVIEYIAKENPKYEANLIAQYDKCDVVYREFSDHGFLSFFEVDDICDNFRDGATCVLGNLLIELEGVQHGASFRLYINNGFINMLEGYVCSVDVWPKEITKFKVVFFRNIS